MIKTASQYHVNTSYERGKIGGHYLDWQNQPDVFKKYQGVIPIPLPDEIPSFKKSLSSVLKETDIDSTCGKIDIKDLSLILRLTCSLTAKARHGAEDFYYRSAASAGALYPTEIYVATHEVSGLDDGLYHFDIRRHELFPLRIHDLSGHIARLLIPPVEKIPTLTLLFTAIFFRSSWKYRDRAYRYHLLDTGHVIENLDLSLKALKLPFNLFYDFDDKSINHLLGLNEKKEVALAIGNVPGPDSVSEIKTPEIEGLSKDILNASIVSGKEIDYPAIQEIHKAGEMSEAKDDLAPDIPESLSLIPATWHNLPGSLSNAEYTEYPECLFKRRSSRNFVNSPISKNAFFSLLDSLCVDENNMPEETILHQSLTVGFLAGNIESIKPGFYVLDTMRKRFGMMTTDNFIGSMTHACLDQAWLGNACIHFLFISNLNLLDKTWGARGYRYAMMKAGRMGELIYIASTCLGLGCCCIGAFYDGEARDLLGINEESSLLYLVAVGNVKSFGDR
ncbi:SagB/ThcOx family dehydrogenase [Deltaproteobacteria bacterium]|nr:SagB/ThcOx family dehydrogenase [Deltaproteobacteria bacterium]